MTNLADKDIKLFPLDSDLMFTSVMINADACIDLLQIIFPDKKIERIEYLTDFNPRSKNFELEIQKFIQLNPPGKSIRLDIYFKDSDTVYNVEMERTNRGKHNTIRRARMYSSLMDANLLNKGMKYQDLIESYVIFLCKFDPFDRKKCIYKFRSMCEDEDLCEGNGRYNIYLNTKGKKDDISFDLKEMFKYINGGTDTIGMKTKSKLVKTIDKYVQEFNSNYTWRQGAMTIDMLIRENYDQGKDEGYKDGCAQGVSQGLAEGISQGLAEGKAKGLQEGRAEARAQIVKNFYSKKIPLETISECTGLNISEVQRIIALK